MKKAIATMALAAFLGISGTGCERQKSREEKSQGIAQKVEEVQEREVRKADKISQKGAVLHD